MIFVAILILQKLEFARIEQVVLLVFILALFIAGHKQPWSLKNSGDRATIVDSHCPQSSELPSKDLLDCLISILSAFTLKGFKLEQASFDLIFKAHSHDSVSFTHFDNHLFCYLSEPLQTLAYCWFLNKVESMEDLGVDLCLF